MAVKVLLDTDIGSNIDDAACLAYLLAQPRCELLGITTVTGEADKRAMLASALCRAAGKSVPIFPGAETPLIVPQKQTRAPQAAVLARWDHETDFPRGQAVEFLRQTIRAHPGEVSLLAIGPLTNVALLFAVDPETPALLKSLVMMCGAFTSRLVEAGIRETNASNDPHATAIVYRAPVRIHRSVGLDVTRQVQMSANQARERFRGGWLELVSDMARVWFQEQDTVTFHDPLAAATLFDNTLCIFERGAVEVELTDGERAGTTHWTPGGPDARHEVAVRTDAARFFEQYFAVLKTA